MEEALHERIKELAKSRSDYDDLLDKYRHSAQLFDEKERLYRDQLQQARLSSDSWKDKCQRLKDLLQQHNSLKVSFQQDVQLLQEAAKLLEQREHDVQQSVVILKDVNAQLGKENGDLKREIANYEEIQGKLNKKCEEEMISKLEYENLSKKCAALQHIIEFDMISKVQYHQLEDDNRRLKLRIEQQCVDRHSYEELETRWRHLDDMIADGEYLKREDYERLLSENQALLEEKRVIETSIRIVNEIKEQNVKINEKNEESLRDSNKRYELLHNDYQQLSIANNHVNLELQQKREELIRQDEDRKRYVEQLMMLENTKSNLLTQVGQLKLTLRNETELRKEVQQQCKAHESKLEDLRTQHLKDLIESNKKITETFEMQEKLLRQRVGELELQLALSEQQRAEKLAENYELKDRLNAFESEYQELSTDAKIRDVQDESRFRDFQTLQKEKDQLQRKVDELTGTLEELRINVMSELSPSFNKYFHVSSSPTQRMSPSSGVTQNQQFAMSSSDLRQSYVPEHAAMSAPSIGDLELHSTPTPAIMLSSQFISNQPFENDLHKTPRSPGDSVYPPSVNSTSVPSTSKPRTNTPPRIRTNATSSRNSSVTSMTPQSKFNMSLNHSGPQWKSPQPIPAAKHSGLTRQLLQTKNNHNELGMSASKPEIHTRPVTPKVPLSPVLYRTRSDSNHLEDHSVVQQHRQLDYE